MKATNIVLSILILLLALASAVFSYFLFEKRDSMIKGWEKMATTINSASVSMDKTSGTQIARELTAAELSHEKYDELDSKLKKLVDQTRKIIAERDDMADALRRVGMNVGVKKLGSEADFRGVATYRTNVDNVASGVSRAMQNRDMVYRELASLANRTLDISVDPKALAEGSKSELMKIADAMNKAKARRQTYERELRNIGECANVSASDFSSSNYNSSVQKISGGVNKLRQNADNAAAELDKANRELVSAKSDIRACETKIEQLNKQIEDLNYDIGKYKVALGVAKEEVIPIPWRPGSPEVRANTVGEVIKVDNEYGYIAVNLGRKTLVTQPLGEKSITVNPMIDRGMELIVARGKLASDAAFVARIKLDEVGDECSTANIPSTAGKIKVGDIVFFDREQQQQK